MATAGETGSRSTTAEPSCTTHVARWSSTLRGPHALRGPYSSREGSDRDRADRRLVGGARSSSGRVSAALLCLAGPRSGRDADGLLRAARRQPRRLLPARRYNHLLGWTADALLGFSSYAWRVKHNIAHHTYTNIDGFDDDATQVPLARFAPSQTPRPWYRFQQYYIWPMYTLMGLRWQTVGDLAAFARGRSERAHCARHVAGILRRDRWQGDLLHVGARDPAARLSRGGPCSAPTSASR